MPRSAQNIGAPFAYFSYHSTAEFCLDSNVVGDCPVPEDYTVNKIARMLRTAHGPGWVLPPQANISFPWFILEPLMLPFAVAHNLRPPLVRRISLYPPVTITSARADSSVQLSQSRNDNQQVDAYDPQFPAIPLRRRLFFTPSELTRIVRVTRDLNYMTTDSDKLVSVAPFKDCKW